MSGPLANLDYHVLAGFLADTMVAERSTVVGSGFLPRAASPEAARGPIGGIFVYAPGLAIRVLLAVLVRTAQMLPWTVSVIAVWLAVLGPYFLTEPLPNGFRRPLSGLLTALALCVAVSCTLSGLILV